MPRDAGVRGGLGRPRPRVKGSRAELSGGLPGSQRGGCLTLSSSCVLLKESLLEPDGHVAAGDCSRSKKGSTENTARRRRDLQVEEEEEEEAAAGEKRQNRVAPRGCQS